MFETLSRRSQSLVEQQLTLIENLERDEDDPGRLQSLFRLDHLATRMRRNGDNLLVLAGTTLRRGVLPPVPLSDMLWSAVSQVEDYQRVEIGAVPDGVVAGEPAVDIEHLLAELIDNSLRYSPPSTPVAVSVTPAAEGGYLIEITDRGLGMSGEDLRSINDRLASGGEVTVETARRMGLFVVGRLAMRHTVTVSLRRTSAMAQQPGITATVNLPASLAVSGASEPAAPQGAPFPAVTQAPALTVVDEPNTGPQPVSLFAPRRRARDDESPLPTQESVQDGVIGAYPDSQELEPFDGESGREPWAVSEPETQRWATPDEPTARNMSRPSVTSWHAYEPEFEAVDDWSAAQPESNGRSRETVGSGQGDTYAPDRYEPETEAAQAVPSQQDWDETQSNGRWNDGYRYDGREHWDRTGQSEPAQRQWGHPPGEPSDPVPGTASATDDSAPGTGGFAAGGGAVLRPRLRRPTAEPWPSGDLPALQNRVPSPEPPEPQAYSSETYAPERTASWTDDAADLWAQTATLPVHQPVAREPVAESPIYQRMVSEWLVEPSASDPAETWASPADVGWAAAAEASHPASANRTSGGLPIRNPGAQLVPGGLSPATDSGAPDPEEIRNNLSRHLSGVRSGRASTARNGNGYNGDQSIGGHQQHDAQYYDGGQV
jgi:anti-sigma regulatory factor (Ser/Thr protein kinase)